MVIPLKSVSWTGGETWRNWETAESKVLGTSWEDLASTQGRGEMAGRGMSLERAGTKLGRRSEGRGLIWIGSSQLNVSAGFRHA